MAKCRINGCSKEAVYKARNICQMHYFRHMRNGHYELTDRQAIPRRKNPKGYVLIHNPKHPLAQRNGYVYEHRKVVYSIYGDSLPDCELCGKACSWEPYTTHIDHIDESKDNNSPENLRVLCNACNVGRSRKPPHHYSHIDGVTWRGETKSANGWSKDPRVSVSGRAIRMRLAKGWPAEEALLTPARSGRKANAKLANELEKARAA